MPAMPLSATERKHAEPVAAALLAVADIVPGSSVSGLRISSEMRDWLRSHAYSDVPCGLLLRMLATTFPVRRDRSNRQRVVYGIRLKPEYDTDVISRPTPNGWVTYRR